MGSDLKLPAANPSRCTMSRASSQNNVIESDNSSGRLPWQHLSTIFITMFSTAHVPSIHNGYSWFYAVQVTLTTMEFVCMGLGSDCSMECAVVAAVCHEP